MDPNKELFGGDNSGLLGPLRTILLLFFHYYVHNEKLAIIKSIFPVFLLLGLDYFYCLGLYLVMLCIVCCHALFLVPFSDKYFFTIITPFIN